MLRELHISNLAVIADARVEFDVGLNCFTGATGAGKSLVIGAIELLLGLRPASDLLRAGADEGRVTGMFQVDDAEQLRQVDAITDLNVSGEGGELLLVRKLLASGRSTASLNGRPITLQMLKQIGEVLVDVHGQHDSTFLLKPSNQLGVVDRFADVDALRERYHEVYAELAEARRKIADLGTGERLRKQQLELLTFQAEEIDKADLSAAEHVELEGRASMLQNVERIRTDASETHQLLVESESSLVDQLKPLAATLDELAALDPQLKPIGESMRSGLIQIEEAAFDLGRYVERLEGDPETLAEVNERLNTINRLLRKYGINVDAVLEFRAKIQVEIDTLSNAAANADELSKKIAPLEKKLRELGGELTKKRQAAARAIGPRVQAQLAELLMEKATFEVAVAPLAEPSPSGLDVVEMIVQTNPGLPAQPLRRIASGGEIGRIMLAIKSVLSAISPRRDAGPSAMVLVFDEIDAAIGGRLGAIIGAKLRQLATSHQVLCITHLPQIACYADRHLTVRKVQGGEKTQTTVRAIAGDERLEELAEMIGGKTVTETTRAQARELLQHAEAESRAPAAAAKKTPVRRTPRAN